MSHALTPFFKPRGVAVIGASSNPTKLSHGIIRNLIQHGYSGKVYPVNPNASEILGLACFPDITGVPDPLDLAVVALPASATPEIIESCGKRGLKAVILITGGFREVGDEGRALEDRCVQIARRYGLRLMGPNCVGTMDLHSRLNTTFIEGFPEKGGIAFLSQSGAICGGIVDMVRGRQIGFSAFASMGNMADVTETDLIEYFAQDDGTRVIALYLEGIQDGSRFMRVANKVSRNKPVVVLKAGRNPAGTRAVSSHTGSIAGSYSAYQTAFRQSGVIEADSVQELFDISFALSNQPVPAGRRAAIVTNAGGPAALISDSLGSYGIELPPLSNKVRNDLRKALNPSAQVGNPVDMLGGASAKDFEYVLTQLAQCDEVDILIPVLVPQTIVNPIEVACSIHKSTQQCSKTVISCFMGDSLIREPREFLHKNGIPMIDQPELIGRILTGLQRRAEQHTSPPSIAGLPPSPRKKVELPDREKLGEYETRPLLSAYGIPMVREVLVPSIEQAEQIKDQLSFPVAMKIVSADILHKSDAGGVRVGIRDFDEVKKEYAAMVERVKRARPDAVIDGVVLAEMAPRGREVIVGMRRDPTFGPMVMFGMGGVFVELYKDVSFRIAPIDRATAKEMIAETKAGRLMAGYRGSDRDDLDAVADVLLKISEIALAYPELDELEINPLTVYPEGQGVLALDSRAIRWERNK